MLAIVVAFVVIKLKPARPRRLAERPDRRGAGQRGDQRHQRARQRTELGRGRQRRGHGQATEISGTALTANGKPEVLYIGAEYCPYCAAERWAMIVALSRFGTFSGLATVHSAAANGAGEAEPYPNTPTWTFVNAKYTSQYLTFTRSSSTPTSRTVRTVSTPPCRR